MAEANVIPDEAVKAAQARIDAERELRGQPPMMTPELREQVEKKRAQMLRDQERSTARQSEVEPDPKPEAKPEPDPAPGELRDQTREAQAEQPSLKVSEVVSDRPVRVNRPRTEDR